LWTAFPVILTPCRAVFPDWAVHKAVVDRTAKTSKSDPAQKARDARREIFQEWGVLSVRRSDWKIEATPQIGFFQRDQLLGFASLYPTYGDGAGGFTSGLPTGGKEVCREAAYLNRVCARARISRPGPAL